MDICVDKINGLFQSIIDNKININRNDCERLLQFFEPSGKTDSRALLETPLSTDLIIHSLQKINSVTIENQIFIIKMVTVMIGNEAWLNRILAQDINLPALLDCVTANLKSTPHTNALHLAYIKMLIAQISHWSGLKLVLQTKTWKTILSENIHLKPLQAKAAYEFMAELVWKLEYYEYETTLNEVLQYIVQPIKSSDLVTFDVFDTKLDKLYSEPIITPLNILLEITSNTDRLIKSKTMTDTLRVLLYMDHTIQKLYCASRDPNIISSIQFFCFKLNIGSLIKKYVQKEKSQSLFLNEILAAILNKMGKIITEKWTAYPMMDFIVKVYIFWSKNMSNTTIFERNGIKYEIENQFMMLLTMPMMSYSYGFVDLSEQKEDIECYDVKILGLLTEHVIKFIYNYKNFLDCLDLKTLTIQNLKDVFKLKGHLKENQAGILFQSLYFVLCVYIPKEKNGILVIEDKVLDADDQKILSLDIEAIRMLLSEHKIHWYKYLDIINLQRGLINLLNVKTLSKNHILQILELLDLCIKNFLSPDMALLVESKQGSALDQVASLIKSYIRHEDWEVRDSALTLLLTCTDIAFVKYIPLQKLITDNQLLLLASEAALTDSDHYVQSTALKCLASSTKIESIWRTIIAHNRSIYTRLLYLSRYNPKEIIRCDIIKVLTQIYINQRTTDTFKRYLYNVMCSAAIDDLHWEVQLAALTFWKHVIHAHFADRGMINGKFPKVIFSKEKRKIITLNEMEIKKILISIMNVLSETGCLTVLCECLNDDFSTVQVMEQAYCLSRELVEILDNHNCDLYDSLACPMDDDHIPTDEPNINISDPDDKSNAEVRDKTIDEILDTELSDLITELSERNIDQDNAVQNFPILSPEKEKVHPNKFLEVVKEKDYTNIIHDKKDYGCEPQTLCELIDEILQDKYGVNCIE